MDRGKIVEMGTHEALLARDRGLYAHLWRMQDRADPNKGLQQEEVIA
jgi:subfamily B ATP-binding cassette protein HlyB/CyaB